MESKGTDVFSKEKRSWLMSNVKSKNTGLERKVRSELHKVGCRFRLHKKELPGVPDIVLPKYKTVIFVHGCFWHQHPYCNCKKTGIPKQHSEFWSAKLERNIKRDIEVKKELQNLGWNVVTIWECEIKSKTFHDRLEKIVKDMKEGRKD